MKTLLIHLDDEEHKALTKVKGKKSWKAFIMQLVIDDEAKRTY